MRFVLFITKPLGQAILEYLIENQIHIDTIITNKGGTGWWGKTEIEEIARKYSILVLYNHKDLEQEHYDLGVSVLYYRVIDPKTISKFDTLVNLHMGELPRYRGTNCTSHAIINARKDNHWFGGATLHHIDKGVDTGSIIGEKMVEITNSTTNRELFTEVEKASYELFKEFSERLVFKPETLPQIPQRSLIDYLNPSYCYYRNSLDKKIISLEEVTDLNFLWDLTRGLEFPPFAPLQIQLDPNTIVAVTTKQYNNNYEDLGSIDTLAEFRDKMKTVSESLIPVFIFIEELGTLYFDKNTILIQYTNLN